LSHDVGSWLSSANIQFPSELLALAYSKKGEAPLEGFNFFKSQNASMMPDRVPLFGLQLADKQQLVSFLRDRGLEIGWLAQSRFWTDRRTCQHQGNRTVFASDARGRLRSRIPSVDASLVWHRQTFEAVGVLASFPGAREIPDYRCLRAVPTTRNALSSLLAWLVRNSPSIPTTRLRHRSNSRDLPYRAQCRLNRALVYTGSCDDVARNFYISIGFEVLGPASGYAPGKTMDDSDIVLRRILAVA
jgi:hypothetical protein